MRDWLLGRRPTDLDITIAADSIGFAKDLARDIKGTVVLLSEAEGVVRVVSGSLWLDISSFRDQTTRIDDDLKKRDFTFNSMAMVFNAETASLDKNIIDPTSGLSDLQNGIIKITSKECFRDDPLRLLRAFRFAATFNFDLEAETKELITQQAALLKKSAGERLTYELDKIMSANSAYRVIKEMTDTGLLWQIYPELYAGVGMSQPASHHLDVFDHNVETFRQMGEIITNPGKFFPGYTTIIKTYLAGKRKIIQLRTAALLHDLGKPVSFKLRQEKRTFYNHDLAGAKMLNTTAKRLKWSIVDKKTISLLIKQHMRPFHLLNAKLKSGITNKAYLKLIKAVGNELIGLFLLAMADSLAGCGPGKPPGMEEALATLFDDIYQINQKVLQPVLTNSLLLNGKDLISLGQKPGPSFGLFFDELEIRQVDNPQMTKDEALEMARNFNNGTTTIVCQGKD